DAALIAQAGGSLTPPNVKSIWDQGGALGGPIRKDRLWFFGASRRWGTKNTVPGNYFNATPHSFVYTPDLSRPAYTWIHDYDNQIRFTTQLTSKQKMAVLQTYQINNNEYYQVDGNRAPEATSHLYWHPNWLTQVTWNYPRTNKLLFDAGFTYLYEFQDGLYPQAAVSTTDIPLTESTTGFTYNARATGVLGQTDYGVGSVDDISVQRFSMSYVTGSHAF